MYALSNRRIVDVFYNIQIRHKAPSFEWHQNYRKRRAFYKHWNRNSTTIQELCRFKYLNWDNRNLTYNNGTTEAHCTLYNIAWDLENSLYIRLQLFGIYSKLDCIIIQRIWPFRQRTLTNTVHNCISIIFSSVTQHGMAPVLWTLNCRC